MEDDKDAGSDSDVNEEVETEVDISALQAQIAANPSDYEAHSKLVAGLRRAGELDKLRHAREAMSKAFPLPEALWHEWTQDEAKLAATKQQKENVLKLFQRSFKDYLSVPLLLSYANFAESVFETEKDKVREVYEEAITKAGLHMLQGVEVWKAWVTFEESHQKKGDKEQTERIRKLYRRFLKLPFVGMEEVMSAYFSWEKTHSGKDVEEGFLREYRKAKTELDERTSFEDAIIALPAPESAGAVSAEHWIAWESYLDFEIQKSAKNNPLRAQILFERAISQCFLLPSSWQKYVQFLEEHLRDFKLILSVCERAVRNVPWSGLLWKELLRCLDRTGASSQEVEVVFSKGTSSLNSPSESIELYLTMIDYFRRHAEIGKRFEKEAKTDPTAVAKIRETFQKAVPLLSAIPADIVDASDSHFKVFTQWTDFEARCMGNLEGARTAWESYLKVRSKEIRAWQGFIAHEVFCGDMGKARTLYNRAVHVLASDWTMETMCSSWCLFEMQCGTLDDQDNANKKTRLRLKDLESYRVKVSDQQTQLAQEEAERRQAKQDKKKRKDKELKAKTKEKKKEELLKAIGVKPDRIKGKKEKGTESTDSSSAPVTLDPTGAEPSVDTTMSTAPSEPTGTRGKGKRKRSDADAVDSQPPQKAVQKNLRRPMNEPLDEDEQEEDTEMTEHKRTHPEEAPGATGSKPPSTEKNTVFVLNIPFDTKDEELQSMFSKCGELEDIRHVRHLKDGSSKGFAYIQYKNDASVDRAINEFKDTELRGRKLEVKISKPVNKANADPRTIFVSGLKPFLSVLTQDELQGHLRKHFQQCGSVSEVRIGKEKTGQMKPFCFIEFENESSMGAALLMDHQKLFVEKPSATGKPKKMAVSLTVVKSEPPKGDKRKPPREGGRGGERSERGDGDGSRRNVAASSSSAPSGPSGPFVPRALGGGGDSGGRGRGDRRQTFSRPGLGFPRPKDFVDETEDTVQAEDGAGKNGNAAAAPSEATPMSNADFRAKFLGK